MDNELGKSTFMKLHLQASKADLTWTIGEKLQFLKQVASIFPTMSNLSAEVNDSTPVQSSDFQWEEIHADLQDFFKDSPQETTCNTASSDTENKTLFKEMIADPKKIIDHTNAATQHEDIRSKPQLIMLDSC